MQEPEHRVGDGADAQLQGGPVVDQLRDPAADGLFHRPDGGRSLFDQIVVALHDVVQLRHVDEGVAVGAGHLGVDLGDHGRGGLGGGLRVVDRDPERAVSELVGRRKLDERDIDRQPAVGEEPGDLEEEHRRVVGPSVGHGLPAASADEQRIVKERVAHRRACSTRSGPRRSCGRSPLLGVRPRVRTRAATSSCGSPQPLPKTTRCPDATQRTASSAETSLAA